MTDTQTHPRHLNGEYIGAIMSAALGLFALGAVVLGSELSKAFEANVFRLGKWMPQADRVGPYSGKETVMLVVWLGSWLVLHLSLRRRRMDPRPWFGVSLFLILAALVMIWPPVWDLLGAS